MATSLVTLKVRAELLMTTSDVSRMLGDRQWDQMHVLAAEPACGYAEDVRPIMSWKVARSGGGSSYAPEEPEPDRPARSHVGERFTRRGALLDHLSMMFCSVISSYVMSSQLRGLLAGRLSEHILLLGQADKMGNGPD